MSYPLLNGDIVEIRLNAQLFNQVVMNTFHYSIGSGSPNDSDLTALADAWENALWTGQLADLLSNDYTDAFVAIQKIQPVRYISEEYAVSPTGGQIASSALPPSSTLVVRRYTQLAGASNRGRLFIPGLPFASTEEGQLSSEVAADWSAWADLLSNPLTFLTRIATPIIYHKATGTAGEPLLGGEYDSVLRSQRRREIRVGI